MALYKGSTQIRHLWWGSTPIKRLYKGTTLLFEQGSPPTIQSFSVTPNSIDLDTRATGTIEFSFVVLGTAGQDTNCQIVQLPGGQPVGTTFVGVNGANLSQTLPNIIQPSQTTSYRLICHNDNGNSHQDITLTVTQNARITNFRRTGFTQVGVGGTFIFQATISGTPQPALTYRFANGTQGVVSSRHMTSTGTNQWNMNWRIFHPNITDSLVLTATNSSGAVTATINNIGA